MAERRYHLARIEVDNFKRFPHLELDLSGFDLLVGPNNSGKSTVLEACRLFDFCYRSCLRGSNGKLNLAPEVSVTGSELPIAGDLLHHQDVPASYGGDPRVRLPPIGIAAVLGRGDRRRGYGFDLEWQGGNQFTIRTRPESDAPIAADLFGVVLVPGFVGLLPQEERRTSAVLRGLRTEGSYRVIIRNLLLDLQRDAPKWGLLKEVLGEVFPDLAMESVEFDEQVDRHIFAPYEERQPGHAQPVRLDLFAAGSGFHQFVQVFAALLTENAPTVLLDEPDAHLFSKLQGQLYQALRKMGQKGFQIIAATHAPNLIAAADPQQIINFAAEMPRRLSDTYEVDQAARELGAFDNLMLLLVQAHGNIIVVEGKDGTDERLLRGFMEALLPPARWQKLQERLVFLPASGRPTADKVNLVLDALQRVFSTPKVRAYVVADRDYRLDEDLTTEQAHLSKQGRQTWRVWQRVEIENYLLNEEAWVSLVTEKARESSRSVPEESELRRQFWIAVESTRERALDGFMDQRTKRNKKWSASKARQEAEKFLERSWKEEGRLLHCDAKKVLRRLRHEVQHLGLRFRDSELIPAVVRVGASPELIAAVKELDLFLTSS